MEIGEAFNVLKISKDKDGRKVSWTYSNSVILLPRFPKDNIS